VGQWEEKILMGQARDLGEILPVVMMGEAIAMVIRGEGLVTGVVLAGSEVQK